MFRVRVKEEERKREGGDRGRKGRRERERDDGGEIADCLEGYC